MSEDLLQIRVTLQRVKDVVVNALAEVNLKEKAEIQAIVEKAVEEADIARLVQQEVESAVKAEVKRSVEMAVRGLFNEHSVQEAVRLAAVRAVTGDKWWG